MPSRKARGGFLFRGRRMKIGFIGAGTVGTALAVLLSRRGYQVIAVASRSELSARKLAEAVGRCKVLTQQQVADSSDLVFITTPDAVIPLIASLVRWHRGMSVVHCSGADSTEVLEPARRSGAAVGGFHPLQAFSSVSQAIENIPGSTFAIEAEEPLFSALKEMASAIGGHAIRLKAQDKVAYHAAAVIASNYLVTLVKMSTDLWKTFNVSTEEATRALLPLVRGTLNNIEHIGLPFCLTGPIARGDAGTVKKHIQMLREKAPELLFAYKELGLQTIPIALAKGKINQEQAVELEAALKTA
ncbi:MAG: DUF2520 domain-containing protein [Dehalococcoidales bacterium]|nr:DUF2520 domain-containing protein [Dehalococcoidales bacterium]